MAAANVLRQNTVIARGLAFGPADARRVAEARACLVWGPEADRAQYQAAADLRAWRAAGVRVGLGSDSPPCGARDLLSTVAQARGLDLLDDAGLLELASAGSAEVARLPVGAPTPGAPADFVLVEDGEAFLRGERASLALVIVAGRPLCGRAELREAAGVAALACGPVALARGLHERARRALRQRCARHGEAGGGVADGAKQTVTSAFEGEFHHFDGTFCHVERDVRGVESRLRDRRLSRRLLFFGVLRQFELRHQHFE